MLAILILISLISAYYIYDHLSRTEVGVQGDVFRNWAVLGSYDNKLEAAQALSRIHSKMIILGRHLKEKYHISETDTEIKQEKEMHISGGHAKELAFYFLRDYNPDVIYESDNKYTSDTSYNISKGEAIYMCMRTKADPNILEDDDILMFVMLHEVSHTILKTNWGHEADFWATFKWLLQEAVEASIYTPIDFKLHPRNFCGLEITYSPLDDMSLATIMGT
jgi:hypothetical protein